MERIYLNFAYDDTNLFGNRVMFNRQDNGVLVITNEPLPDTLFKKIIPQSYKNKKRITFIHKCKWNKYFVRSLTTKLDKYFIYVKKFKTSDVEFNVYKGVTQLMQYSVLEVLNNGNDYSAHHITSRMRNLSVNT